MKKLNKEAIFSPAGIFVLYLLVSSLVIFGFTFIFPGETAPIAYFYSKWRLVRGCLNIIRLFPALALSALVIPFGIVSSLVEGYGSFSAKFLDRLRGPIITAIIAAVVNGVLFFIPLPLAQASEENMRFEGELYRLSREKAKDSGAAGDWQEASRFIIICENIWPGSPEMETIKAEAAIQLEASRFEEYEQRIMAEAEASSPGPAGTIAGGRPGAGVPAAALTGIPNQPQPVSASEALTLAGTALENEQFYSAHWLATLAGRLSKDGSPEAAEAARMASRAWNAVMSLAPNAREREAYSRYRLKLSGYEAMVSGDWIGAYYIFQELIELTPSDPDVADYLLKSENGTRELAFFTDEIDMSAGEILTEAVFSLPLRPAEGRGVLRFSSLSALSDFSFGMGLEYLSFDHEGRPLSRAEAPYAKILPVTLEGRSQTLVLMRALDRHDRNKRWEPVWLQGTRPPIGGQIVLDISYENFLLLTQIRRGLGNLFIGELWSAAKDLGAYGHIPQVFQAEIINRIGIPLFFLPLSVIALIIGWRYRAKKKPRYLFIPMLPVLPLVWSGIIHFCGIFLNILGIWTVISLGFSAALTIFIGGITAAFFLSLIFLAAQHG